MSRQDWDHAAPEKRIRGRKLQALRQQLFERHPFCQQCDPDGKRLVRATIRDHIIPRFEGGPEDEWNIQALCQACSDKKTAQEALRAKLPRD